MAVQARHDIHAAQLDRGFIPFIVPLWLFSSGIAIAVLGAVFYFARPNRSQRLGAAIGGVVWGLGMAGRMRVENVLGWWWSRIAGNEDPLLLLSRWTWIIFPVAGIALLLILLMIGRRFGWKGQVLSLALLGLYQAVRERIWLGELIPALDYKPGILPVLGAPP